MGSLTKITVSKRNNHLKSQGRKRKNKQSLRSTLTAAELFAEVDAAKAKTKGK